MPSPTNKNNKTICSWLNPVFPEYFFKRKKKPNAKLAFELAKAAT
jgi:hypothetical protein